MAREDGRHFCAILWFPGRCCHSVSIKTHCNRKTLQLILFPVAKKYLKWDGFTQIFSFKIFEIEDWKKNVFRNRAKHSFYMVSSVLSVKHLFSVGYSLHLYRAISTFLTAICLIKMIFAKNNVYLLCYISLLCKYCVLCLVYMLVCL